MNEEAVSPSEERAAESARFGCTSFSPRGSQRPEALLSGERTSPSASIDKTHWWQFLHVGWPEHVQLWGSFPFRPLGTARWSVHLPCRNELHFVVAVAGALFWQKLLRVKVE